MSAHLGVFGRLVPIYSTPSMSVSGIPERRVELTAERKVKVHVAARGRRTWSLDASHATPDEVGALMGFASGEWGLGPFLWVPPDAPGTNLITPGRASCDPQYAGGTVAAAGPMLTPFGWAGRSFQNSDPAGIIFFGSPRVPVLPGVPVTVSAVVIGAGARVRVGWYNAAGAAIGTADSAVLATAGAPVRSFLTVPPPAGAASCTVSAPSAVQATRPAITWSSELLRWADGRGCDSAIVLEVERSALSASRLAGGPSYSNLSFSIIETG